MASDPRSYIVRLQRDPRTRAMLEGWIAQATRAAEERYPDPCDDRQRAHFAARTALELAMSFITDNDGELQAALAERDQAREQLLRHIELAPTRILTVPAAEEHYGE